MVVIVMRIIRTVATTADIPFLFMTSGVILGL
jgi:hypothetical protein